MLKEVQQIWAFWQSKTLNPGISHSYDMFSNPPTCLVTISPVAGSVPRRYWLAAGSTPSLCTPPSENFTRNSYTFSLDVYNLHDNKMFTVYTVWTASSEFGTYNLCEQRRFRRACAFAQSRQNLRCSLIQAVSREEPSDRKPDPWPLWMAGHAQLKFVMTECLKTQIRLTGLVSRNINDNKTIFIR